MPALVPAGYTRGAILFLGPFAAPAAEAKLLQRFWNEAGAYGSRILIVACARTASIQGSRIRQVLADWESESVETLLLEKREQAANSEGLDAVARATGILIVGEQPLRLAGLLGGTALAQAIRRANAQNKVICGVGGGATLLCQHMMLPAESAPAAGPLVHRDMVNFAPGLGIVNRLVLDARGENAEPAGDPLGRLLAAVAFNPFLVGVHLQADTGAVVYPNTVMEIFGDRSALVVDGMQMRHNSLPDAAPGQALSLLGVQIHVLGSGCTFTFDTRVVAAPGESDLTLGREAIKAAF
jgi:cyanophycinase